MLQKCKGRLLTTITADPEFVLNFVELLHTFVGCKVLVNLFFVFFFVDDGFPFFYLCREVLEIDVP